MQPVYVNITDIEAYIYNLLFIVALFTVAIVLWILSFDSPRIYSAAGVVVSCKIPILVTRVRFPGGAWHVFPTRAATARGARASESDICVSVCVYTSVCIHTPDWLADNALLYRFSLPHTRQRWVFLVAFDHVIHFLNIHLLFNDNLAIPSFIDKCIDMPG